VSLLAKLLDRLRSKPPVIPTKFGGPVTESARLRAALNMRDDEGLRHRVEEVIIKEFGGDIERGLKECRRRYPESYRKGK
jgi:hypothetical protein